MFWNQIYSRKYVGVPCKMLILHGNQLEAVKKCISTRVMSPWGFHGLPCSNNKLLHEKWIEQTKQSMTLLGTNNLSHTHTMQEFIWVMGSTLNQWTWPPHLLSGFNVSVGSKSTTPNNDDDSDNDNDDNPRHDGQTVITVIGIVQLCHVHRNAMLVWMMMMLGW